ncbi:MAG: hypothetical protein ACRC6V_02025 [Bacteroidales bacterium]
MMYNKGCLSEDDPEQLYNYLSKCVITPENFGIEHPTTEEFKDYTRSQLIKELLDTRRELAAYHKAGF